MLWETRIPGASVNKALAVLTLGVALAGCSPAPAPQTRTCRYEIAADPAGTPTARIFAVGLRQDLAGLKTYADYRRFVFSAIESEVPCFSAAVPNLVVFPEDAALAAAFLGSRGEKARAQSDALGAFAHLFTSYQAPLRWYQTRFPGAPPVRGLLLALTDVIARAVEDTFPQVARQYGVYVATSFNAAPYEPTTDAAVLAEIGDPDLPPGAPGYVATEAEVYNFSVVYGPDGNEIGRVRKAYLVPTEESLLEMSYGPLEQMRPIATPLGRLGPVISKDAWMPDVLERLNDLDADITLQHEAFSGWAIEQESGDWLPDVVQESGWNHVQAYDSFRYSVFPCLTGNLLDLVFDCQSALVKESAADDTALAFIGQPATPGYLHIGPWATEDPIGLPLAERRARLREHGEALRPGGARENQYVLSSARGDIVLPRSPAGLALRADTGAALDEARETWVLPPEGEDRNQIRPDIACTATRCHVIWLEDGAEGRRLRHAAVSDAQPAGTDLFTAGAGERIYGARVTAVADRVHVVFVHEHGDPDAPATSLRLLTLAEGLWTESQAFDTAVNGGAGAGAAKWSPAIAASHAGLFVVWTDRRAGSSDILLARGTAAADAFTLIRLDEPHADKMVANRPGNPRNNQALPSIAAHGNRVAVTWADFRDYHWDIYAAFSTDAASTWSANERLNAPSDRERIFGPNAVLIDGATTLALFSGVDDRGPMHRLGEWASGGDTGNMAPLEAGAPAWRPALCRAVSGAAAVWQASSDGELDIHGAVRTSAGWSPTEAIASAPGRQFNPRCSGVVVVYEDWRTGRGRIVATSLTSGMFTGSPRRP